MKPIPKTQDSMVLRTDFSDEAAWQALCVAIETPTPDEGFQAGVEFIDDRDFEGTSVETALDNLPGPEGWWHTFFFIVDHEAIANPEHPILVVDLSDEPGRTFRVIPSEMWGVENNLWVANMDWEDFADRVDADGVFRGFV
ncbi:MAG: hypothetical protein K8I30_19825 [Anaerolineae bacterium]|nr:hypothetical protein [Anaerolineae bacterium]